MAQFDLHDDGVVVIVGSGAGGGTLVHGLCDGGIDCVVLEGGPQKSVDSYVKDEWESYDRAERKLGVTRTNASPEMGRGTL